MTSPTPQCARPTCTRLAAAGGGLDFCEPHHLQARAAGVRGRQDAADVVAHVRDLQALGWNLADVAKVAHVHVDSVVRVVRRGRTKLLPKTKDAILSVRDDQFPPDARGCNVDGTGFYRRMEALSAIGWPVRSYADRLGVRPDTIRTRRWQTRVIPAYWHRRMVPLYDELSMRPGPNKSSIVSAKRYNWAPPLAWDDETIDDPLASPAAGLGDLTRARAERERSGASPLTAEALSDAIECGWTVQKIGRVYGRQVETVRAALSKHGLQAGSEQIARERPTSRWIA